MAHTGDYDECVIEPGKIFVGGLSWDTTPESMKMYFSSFGEVTECVVMKNPGPEGKPRGFGFVTFSDSSSVDKVMAYGKHILDKKAIDPKQATVKGKGGPNRKIFIGGLSLDTNDETVKSFFESQNYHVVTVDLKTNPQGHRRGFGFVDFVTEEEVERACATQYFMIDQKKVEVKKAEPRNAREKKDNGMGRGMVLGNQMMYNQAGGGSFGYSGGANVGGRYSSEGGNVSHYGGGGGGGSGGGGGGGGGGSSNYPYQYGSAYGDYQASYGQAGNSALYQNYSGYSGRGYNGQQQMGSNYSQDSTFSQPRSGYGGGGGGTDSYSTGSSNYGYDQSYGYGEQSSGTPSYSRLGTTVGSGQSRGGGSSYHY